MTNEHLSTIELETGFLRRDGNPVAADEIERAARELARTTTMTDVDTDERKEIVKALLETHRSIHPVSGNFYNVLNNPLGPRAADMIEALTAERDELERLAGDARELIDQVLGEMDEAPIGPHKVELALLHERLTAYQRKGE